MPTPETKKTTPVPALPSCPLEQGTPGLVSSVLLDLKYLGSFLSRVVTNKLFPLAMATYMETKILPYLSVFASALLIGQNHKKLGSMFKTVLCFLEEVG